MSTSVLGQIGRDTHVKHRVLSHRMLKAWGKENQTQDELEKYFSGAMEFANDLDCFPVN